MLGLFTLLLGVLVAGGDVVPAPPSGEHLESCAKARAALARPGGGELSVRLLAPPDNPQAAATDVLHYRLELAIDPTAHRLTGTNTITVRCVSGTTTFRFRLDDLFTIGAVTVDGASALWQRIDGETVEVALGRTRGAGETFVLVVPYDGFPTSQYGSIVFSSHSSQPVVYTLSEPWYAYTWWPAKDDNRDKATADLIFTVPAGLTVVSNGRLLGVEPTGGGRQRFHWQTAYETAPYLFSFAATNYSTVQGSAVIAGLTMPVSLYIYPEHDIPANRSQWLQAVTMLGVFSDIFGPYPFAAEKYGIYQFPPGGGMEHQTITGQGSFLEYLTAHELAHQWWGDLVTCATWHDIWLNEGFATYAEALWYERKPGSPGEAWLRQTMELREPSSVDGTVYCYDDSSAARIFSGNFSYRKAGWVMHMLRHVVGDDAFFAALAAWRAEFAFSDATTADFQRVVETVSSRDLDAFFQQWVYQPGAPTYRYSWRPVTAAGSRFVELFLEQIQSAAYPTFSMPVDVEVTGGGASEVVSAWNDARAEHLLLPVGLAAESAELDPDHWILRQGRVASSFVAGPPKVVRTMPAPGSLVAPFSADQVTVVFHEDVEASVDRFSLVGARTGPVPVTLTYEAAAFTAHLTPASPLAPDVYTLTIGDALTSLTGLALDGEMSANTLPSGDGLPGGAFVTGFTVARRSRPRLVLPPRSPAPSSPQPLRNAA